MPQTSLTQLAVERLAPPKAGRVVHWDKLLPGFGLRITANGAKSWVGMYRVNGKTVMETLGPLAKIPRVVDARVLARESMAKAATGEHPVEARERQSASIFGAVAELFLERYARKHTKPSSWKEVERQLRVDILPKWGKRPIASISRKDVTKLLQGIEDRGAPVQANRTRAHLHTLFNWSMRADLITENPVSKVDKAVPERARDRVLADTEIVLFWEAACKLGWPFGPLFKLLLVTAQRRDEVCGITWDELDLERRVWTIPRERAKNDRAHEVHLSDFALEIISEIPRQNTALLFTTNGTRQLAASARQNGLSTATCSTFSKPTWRRRAKTPSRLQSAISCCTICAAPPPLQWPGSTYRHMSSTAC